MKKILLYLLGVLLLGILAGYGISWFMQQPRTVKKNQNITVEEQLPEIEVLLYFADEKGTYLRAETRQIQGCEEEQECVRNLVQTLIKGPASLDSVRVLPKEAEVLDVEIENDLVRINFSRQLADFHPGGSLTELLSIYSLANSLNENFPYLRQLQILVEGEIRQTLKGHVRIDQAVYADFSFSQPPLSMREPAQDDGEKPADNLSIEQLIEKAGETPER